MKTAVIRKKFLDFFKLKNHSIKDSFPLIPYDDPTLLFTSAGMAPFKPYFLGLKTDLKRAASCQKCFRTTDIDNVGYTGRHHTFFEMLGNFSFGDYFKTDAIVWAWEFITKELSIDPSQLYVSIHENDDEAEKIWQESIGLSSDRIVRLGDKDNFWTIGIGPSGPCSEIYFDQGPELGCGKPTCKVGCECSRFLEFWNLVFTQYNRSEDGTLTPLEKKNIDTGMGLERLASIIQGKTDNFQNDVFSGLMTEIESLTKVKFNDSAIVNTSLKVVSDHIRALVFTLAEGEIPGNEGRGYVIKKILRRAARFGYRYLNQDKPFLYLLVPHVARIMNAYPELERNIEHITKLIQAEEERFLCTLKTGTEILNSFLFEIKKNSSKILPGEKAFLLHDTYGFPLELTTEICREEEILVDSAAFSRQIEKQRERGRANIVSAFVNFHKVNPNDFPPTKFVGYHEMKSEAKVLGIMKEEKETLLITNVSPFYAASGGQVGDQGNIASKVSSFEVHSTENVDRVIVHKGILKGKEFAIGEEVKMAVDKKTRLAIMRNHTATHLLHKVLQEVLGSHVKQAGSLVAPDRLRFDFSHFEPITSENVALIEKCVNQRILEDLKVKTQETSYKDAIEQGAMALFSEKYGDIVRLVDVGNGYSKELCGGTHLENTAKVGIFSIISESSIASGIRRIEALTGQTAFDHVKSMQANITEWANLLECPSQTIGEKLKSVISENQLLKREIEILRKNELKTQIEQIRLMKKQIGNLEIIMTKLVERKVDEMKQMADELVAQRDNTAVLLVSRQSQSIISAKSSEEATLPAPVSPKITFVLKLSSNLAKGKFNAGKLIKEISKVAGGSGGGGSEMATAGAKDPLKIDQAFAFAEKILQQTNEN